MSNGWQPAGFTPDRALQRDLLTRMQQVYPDRLGTIDDIDWPTLVSQLHYLEEHRLCDAGLLPNMVGFSWQGCRITAAGLDFLADDGGLTAILGTVTIKLHADTIKDLLATKVDGSASISRQPFGTLNVNVNICDSADGKEMNIQRNDIAAMTIGSSDKMPPAIAPDASPRVTRAPTVSAPRAATIPVPSPSASSVASPRVMTPTTPIPPDK